MEHPFFILLSRALKQGDEDKMQQDLQAEPDDRN